MGESLRDRLLDASAVMPVDRTLQHVYTLWAAGAVAYVGYTRNIHRRLADHLKDGVIEFDGYTFVTVPTRREALDLEAAMIHELRPLFNDVGRRSLYWLAKEASQ